MTDPPKEAVDSQDLLIESINPRKVERPRKLESLVDTQAMRFLEAMDFQSFNNLSSAFEQFMMDAPLFQGDASFGQAAMALDLTAQLFPIIDRDKDSLLSREEFAYLLQQTNDANRTALSWLMDNFAAFSQACFFKDQIGKDDIEAARNVFHGLKIVKDKFGLEQSPTMENLGKLDPDQLKDFLDKNGKFLSKHEATGLTYLIDHIRKHFSGKDRSKGKETDEASKPEDLEKQKENEITKGGNLKNLEGVLDERSLKTLKGLKLNSFENMLNAFTEFMVNGGSYKGDSPFTKAANAINASASLVDDLDMDKEHEFTQDELLIVSKLATSKGKKQLGWLVKHFEEFTRAFSFGKKTKKRQLLAAGHVFNGLDFVREDLIEEAIRTNIPVDKLLKNHLAANYSSLKIRKKVALEQLVKFMETHANK